MKYKLTLLTYFKARAHISVLWEKTDKELKFHKAVMQEHPLVDKLPQGNSHFTFLVVPQEFTVKWK